MQPAGNAIIWPYWQATATTGSSIQFIPGTWAAWNQSYSTGTTTAQFLTTNIVTTATWTNWNAGWTETREQRELRERQNREWNQRQSELRAARVAASDRALELLAALLTDEQMASYRNKGWFEVRGSKGGRWRIRNRGQSGNVDLMPEIGEERLATYCAHPPENLPDADAHLAQVLALVTDEDAFTKVANLHYRRPAA